MNTMDVIRDGFVDSSQYGGRMPGAGGPMVRVGGTQNHLQLAAKGTQYHNNNAKQPFFNTEIDRVNSDTQGFAILKNRGGAGGLGGGLAVFGGAQALEALNAHNQNMQSNSKTNTGKDSHRQDQSHVRACSFLDEMNFAINTMTATKKDEVIGNNGCVLPASNSLVQMSFNN